MLETTTEMSSIHNGTVTPEKVDMLIGNEDHDAGTTAAAAAASDEMEGIVKFSSENNSLKRKSSTPSSPSPEFTSSSSSSSSDSSTDDDDDNNSNNRKENNTHSTKKQKFQQNETLIQTVHIDPIQSTHPIDETIFSIQLQDTVSTSGTFSEIHNTATIIPGTSSAVLATAIHVPSRIPIAIHLREHADPVEVVGLVQFSQLEQHQNTLVVGEENVYVSSKSLLSSPSSLGAPRLQPKEMKRKTIFLTFLYYVVVFGLIVMKLSPNVIPLSKVTPYLRTPLMFTSTTSNTVVDGSVYVAGGGLSGFWYTLGRLQSITRQQKYQTNLSNYDDHQYYCYSAGCLAVVVAMNEFSMEHIYEVAVTIQKQWLHGQIHQYDIVSTFVDEVLSCQSTGSNETESHNFNCLLHRDETIEHVRDQLNRINIITTQVPTADASWYSTLWLQPSIRKPSTLNELKTMLLQTTFIPYVVGNGLTIDNHLDGAFSTFWHPSSHQYHLGLTTDLELMLNVLNFNLQHEQVQSLWMKGYQHGL